MEKVKWVNMENASEAKIKYKVESSTGNFAENVMTCETLNIENV